MTSDGGVEGVKSEESREVRERACGVMGRCDERGGGAGLCFIDKQRCKKQKTKYAVRCVGESLQIHHDEHPKQDEGG